MESKHFCDGYETHCWVIGSQTWLFPASCRVAVFCVIVVWVGVGLWLVVCLVWSCCCGGASWGGFVGCELDSGRDDASLCVCNVFLLLLVF